MGLPKFKTKISVEDYLEREKLSSTKHEYLEGEVFAKAGSSDNHNFIAGDIYAALLLHLRNSICQPFFGDIKVRVRQDVYYYPDVLVSCEQNPDNHHFRNNPILIIEAQVHRRQENGGWITNFFNELDDIVELTSVDLNIPLPEIYRRVTFEPNANREEY